MFTKINCNVIVDESIGRLCGFSINIVDDDAFESIEEHTQNSFHLQYSLVSDKGYMIDFSLYRFELNRGK